MWLYLNNKTNLFCDNLNVLHFGPEFIFQKQFRKMPNLNYTSADLDSPPGMIKMDITNITFEDCSFDVILCSHVLEHVVEDLKAMKELFRVLKPAGWGILQVPIEKNREKTYEDPAIVSPKERALAFGQNDHVRIYGRDYKNRLESAGFSVNIDSYTKGLSPETIKTYVLDESEDIYLCTKPNPDKPVVA